MKGRARRWTIAIVGMAVGVLGLGALMPVDAAQGDVTYVLTWDTAGVTPGEQGGWATTTDLGYVVTVDAGYLTTYTVTMVECEHGHGFLGWLLGSIGPGIADAGHSSDDDPALVGGPVAEDLVATTAISLGTTTVTEPAYCEGHTAWGATDPDAATLVVSGTWVSPDGSVGSIDLASTIDWGVGGELGDETGAVHIEPGEPATVEIIRSLATMFDGIDFASVDDSGLAMGIYRALAASTRFEVVAGTAHA